MKAILTGIFGATSVMLVTRVALAGEPGSPDGGYGTVGALVGVGTADYTLFGAGARAGYTFPTTPTYLGGSFIYHFGKDNLRSYVFGVEGGYDLSLHPVVMRPYLGIGDAVVRAKSLTIDVGGMTSGGGFEWAGNFAFWPGLSVIYPIGAFFVGADARVQFIPDATASEHTVSFGAFATLGMSF